MSKRVVTEKSKSNLKSYKPGQSGNPKGKKKGTKNFRTIIKEMMDYAQIEEDPFTKEKRKISNREKIIYKLISISFKKTPSMKDLKAIEILMNREEGAPVQTQHIGGLDGDSINIKEISDKMTPREASQIYLTEIRNPLISQTINEKKARKRKPKKGTAKK